MCSSKISVKPALPDIPAVYEESEDVNEEENEKLTSKLTDDLCDEVAGGMNKVILSTWDFGGQRVFYTVHHLFLTAHSVYIVVFSMLEFEGKWIDPINKSAAIDADNPTARRKKCIKRIKMWLNSISMHAPRAPVLLVGTFADFFVNDINIIKKISERLQEECKDIVCFSKDLVRPTVNNTAYCFFPISNKTREPVIFADLRKMVGEAVNKKEIDVLTQQIVPYKWLDLYDKLKDKVDKDKTFTLEFDDILKNLAPDCKMPSVSVPSEVKEQAMIDEVKQALLYFHELGYLVYYDVPGLDNMIVLDPQWIVNRISTIIRRHNGLHILEGVDEIKRKFSEEWNNFTKNGVISKRLLKILWAGHDYSSLVNLLCKFNLLLPLTTDKASFLVPSMIRTDEDFPQLQSTLPPKKAIVVFKTGDAFERAGEEEDKALGPHSFLPAGVFDSLLCRFKVRDLNNCIPSRDEIKDYSRQWIHGFVGGVEFVLVNDEDNDRLVMQTSPSSDIGTPVLETLLYFLKCIQVSSFKKLFYKVLVEVQLKPGFYIAYKDFDQKNSYWLPRIGDTSTDPDTKHDIVIACDQFTNDLATTFQTCLTVLETGPEIEKEAKYRRRRLDIFLYTSNVVDDNYKSGAFNTCLSNCKSLKNSKVLAQFVSIDSVEFFFSLDENVCNYSLLQWWFAVILAAERNELGEKSIKTVLMLCPSKKDVKVDVAAVDVAAFKKKSEDIFFAKIREV